MKTLQPQKKHNTTPTEYQECVTLASYLQLLHNQGKVLEYAHIVNELSLNRRAGQKPNMAYLNKRKAEGWRGGVPDYLVVLKNKVIFIEMKRQKGSVISDNQKSWLQALTKAGVKAKVCHGFEAAKEFINQQMEEL